jgi:hypothetical protein
MWILLSLFAKLWSRHTSDINGCPQCRSKLIRSYIFKDLVCINVQSSFPQKNINEACIATEDDCELLPSVPLCAMKQGTISGRTCPRWQRVLPSFGDITPLRYGRAELHLSSWYLPGLHYLTSAFLLHTQN